VSESLDFIKAFRVLPHNPSPTQPGTCPTCEDEAHGPRGHINAIEGDCPLYTVVECKDGLKCPFDYDEDACIADCEETNRLIEEAIETRDDTDDDRVTDWEDTYVG
jgi:hypothetical protein